MSSIAHVYTGSWGNTSLERIDLNAPAPLASSTFDWASNSLPLGALTSWRDLNANHDWPCFGGVSVIEDQGGRAVATNGVDGLLIKNYAAAQPETIVIVARYRTIPTNGAFLMNPHGADNVTVGVASSGTSYISSAGTSATAGTGAPLVDTNYHLLITVFDGANSSVMVDNVERVGANLGPNARAGFRGGYGASYSNIAYKRVVRLPWALTASQRAGVRDIMNAQYNLGL